MSPDNRLSRTKNALALAFALLSSTPSVHSQDGRHNQPPVISSSGENPSMLFMPAVSFEPTVPLDPPVEAAPVNIEDWKFELSSQMMGLGIAILPNQIKIDVSDYTPSQQQRVYQAFSITFEQFFQARMALYNAGLMDWDELDAIFDKPISKLTILSDPSIRGAATTQTYFDDGRLEITITLGTTVPSKEGTVANELMHLLINVEQLYRLHPQAADYISEALSTAVHLAFVLNQVGANGTAMVSLEEMREYLREVRTHSYLNWSKGETVPGQEGVMPDGWNSLKRILSSIHTYRQEIFPDDWIYTRVSESEASAIIAELLDEPNVRRDLLQWVLQFANFLNKGESGYDETRHGPMPRVIAKLRGLGRHPTAEQEAEGPKMGPAEIYAWDVARPWGSEELTQNGRIVAGTSMLNIALVREPDKLRIYPPTATSISTNNRNVLIDLRYVHTVNYVDTAFMGIFFETASITDRNGVPIVPPDGTVFIVQSEIEGVKMTHQVVYNYRGSNPDISIQVSNGEFAWSASPNVLPTEPLPELKEVVPARSPRKIVSAHIVDRNKPIKIIPITKKPIEN